MFYWLFTDGRALLDSFLVPLLCLTIFAPIVIAALLGVGIQRDNDGPAIKGRRRLYVLTAYVIVNLGATALFLALLSNLALTRPTGKPTTNSFILFLNGAPPQVNQMRLFLMGVLLIMTWFMVSIGLHQLLRNGGWLRERIDYLRRPNTRRGTMGSAHFCTFREYRRYRRQDKDGVTFLGAFWGDGKRRLDQWRIDSRP